MSEMCKGCGDPVRMIRTGSGRLMPVDPEPVEDGNVEIVDTLLGEQVKVWGSSHVWPDSTPRYRAHFVTCPDADRFRRPKHRR